MFDMFALVAQMQFKDPRAQSQDIFCDFTILLESSYDSGENEALFVKVGARVPNYGQIRLLGSTQVTPSDFTDSKGKAIFEIS